MPQHSSQFEEIYIPPVLLADMYSNTLVIIDAVENKSREIAPVAPPEKATESPVQTYVEATGINIVAEPPAPAIKTVIHKLGGFGKSILVIVRDENAVHVSDQELELLVKMLAAVDLSLADIALVNLASQLVNFEQLNEALPASTTFLFGVEPSSIGLPMRFPYFQVQKWNNAIFLYSPSLKQMNIASEAQGELKRNLWQALKEIFKK